MSERKMGEVKWFNNKKGYGFITLMTNELNEDIFVHYKDIAGDGFKTLNEHEKVSFQLDESAKGLKAKDVLVVTEE